MRRAVIWGREVEMQGSPFTFLVFREEFGGDLAAFLVATYKKETPETEDYLRIAWSMARTHDPAIPAYADWLKGFGEFSLRGDSPIGVIDSAIAAELFCRRKAGKARKRLGRWLGRVSKRLVP